MDLRQNEPLGRHTTLKVGGPARFFVEAHSQAVLLEALDFTREKNLKHFILGGGSNILVNDAGFDGLVIKVTTCGMALNPCPASSSVMEVVAEAGEAWDALVGFAVENGLFGLENMSLIPGTVGGAVVGNIGAYGAELKDALGWVEAIDSRTGGVRRFTPDQCEFRYRHCYFKTLEGRNYIVTRAAFALSKNGSVNLRYKEVRDYFAASQGGTQAGAPQPHPGLNEVRAAIIAIRERKLPAPEKTGTAGSFFKNPVISIGDYEALAARYPGLPCHEEEPGKVKIPLGWVLDKICGLKGVRQGKVGTHPQQALVIVNEGGTAAEIGAFAAYLTSTVKAFTNLAIEWEVEKV